MLRDQCGRRVEDRVAYLTAVRLDRVMPEPWHLMSVRGVGEPTLRTGSDTLSCKLGVARCDASPSTCAERR
jgi:hypothetical protein